VTTLIVVVILAVVMLHVLGGAEHHRRRSRGLQPRFYWSSKWGPYGSIKIGGFRIGHKL
jgi:hypothetical protein